MHNNPTTMHRATLCIVVHKEGVGGGEQRKRVEWYNEAMKTLVLVLIVIVVLIYFYPSSETQTAQIGDTIIKLEVADTDTSRIKGLSGRESLPSDTGLLFVFEKPDKYGIWMKDMRLPIDIAWIDQNFKIVHIEQKISPDTYPKIFYPTEDSLYVLETNAGFLSQNNIKIGDLIDF